MSADYRLPAVGQALERPHPWSGRVRPLRDWPAARVPTFRPLVAGRFAVPIFLTLFALALRVIPWLAGYPLHRDEALYGAWARLIASARDPLLLTAWVDKPPLAIYLMAGSLQLFGVSRLALRVPGMLAALLTTPIVYALTLRLCHTSADAGATAERPHAHAVAALAGLLYALSPFAILFAPTAFTDGWLTLFLLVSAWAALAGRPFWAGLALGCAVASKQQGVLAVPLVIAMIGFGPAFAVPALPGPALPGASRRRWPRVLAALGLVLLGFALIFGPLMYWDSLRWAKRPSFWDRSMATYGPLGLAPLAAWPTRAAEWGSLLAYFYGRPIISAAVFLLAALGATSPFPVREGVGVLGTPGVRFRLSAREGVGVLGTPGVKFRLSPWQFLLLYVAGFIALHWLISFQAWDRYLLPLVPLVGILAARGVADFVPSVLRMLPGAVRPPWRASWSKFCALILAVALGGSAWLGIDARLPVGSDHGAYDGLDHVISTVTARPADSVIYYQSLGWFFDFYLFDAPQTRRWWGTPWKLADDAGTTARRQPGREQWLVLTGWEDAPADDARLALAARGLTLVPQAVIRRADGTRSFLLYRILPATLAPVAPAPVASTASPRPHAAH
jgi:4-amino-4-deoxy-L-arabinose transferase-like glycosyltransferase